MREKTDPLYTIFEQHLYNFQDSEQDRKSFIAQVIRDYLKYLTKLNIVIPRSLEATVIEELAVHVNAMLVKKIYGCLTIGDFQSQASGADRRRARGRYARLNKPPRRRAKPQPRKIAG